MPFQGTELEDDLTGNGPYTFLAPTDAAFYKLEEEDLKILTEDKNLAVKILRQHILPGKNVDRISQEKYICIRGVAESNETDFLFTKVKWKLSEVNTRAGSRGQNKLIGKFKMAAGDVIIIKIDDTECVIHVAEALCCAGIGATSWPFTNRVETLSGRSVSVRRDHEGRVHIGSTTVLDCDIPATNGIIHAVNRVSKPVSLSF